MCVCVFHIITGYCHLNAAIIPEASHALVCLYLRPTLAFVTVQVSQALGKDVTAWGDEGKSCPAPNQGAASSAL